MSAPRGWGYWSEAKLDILGSYLPAFVRASKRAGLTIYLDLFAGRIENFRKDTGSVLAGSSVRALRVTPPIDHLVFFELAAHASQLRASLEVQFPGRQFRVYEGDCNIRIGDALTDLSSYNWAPTFAFVDPDGLDVRWTTIEAVSSFKRSNKPKAELWLLVPTPAFPRMLGLRGEQGQRTAELLTTFYGTDDWLAIHQRRLNNSYSAEEARFQYVNLMRWRIEHVLGYRYTHYLELKNVSGSTVYHMVFASDHDTGNKIMRDVYASAARRIPAMRSEALEMRRQTRALDKGALQLGLNLGTAEPSVDDVELYQHVPPVTPPEFLENLDAPERERSEFEEQVDNPWDGRAE